MQSTNPWFAIDTFPGGYCSTLCEVLPVIEASRLMVTYIEILHLTYAETLRH